MPVVDGHEAAVHEVGEGRRHVGNVDLPVGHNALRRLERERPGDHGETAQHGSFPLGEQPEAAVERGAQAAVPAVAVTPAADEQPQTVGHTLDQLRDGERSGEPGGQLDPSG